MKYSTSLKIILPILLVFLNCPSSHAHKIRIFAWEESGTIKTETQFSRGRAATNAAITVVNESSNQELLAGTTDNHGFFSFVIPKAAKENRYDLNIVVNSGDGHKSNWHLKAADYLQTQENVQILPPPSLPVPQKIADEHEFSACIVDEVQLTQIIESTLEKKLAPIKRSLAKQQDKKPSLQDILGGIGYILGLAGITAYFKSKK